tara:strand:+ start:1284 stop:1499 length:216 start_codon:yes stop_codon:yes gene_type:complete
VGCQKKSPEQWVKCDARCVFSLIQKLYTPNLPHIFGEKIFQKKRAKISCLYLIENTEDLIKAPFRSKTNDN